MTAGQSVPVSVTMRNDGTTTWTAGSGYKLGSQNPQDNMTWGLNRVNLPASVPPGATAAFIFNVTAPASAGTYNFQWRMQRDGVGFFGGASTNVAVNISGGGGGGGTDGAAFVTQSVPASLNTGQSSSVSVTMNNNGTTTWSPGVYKLGSLNSTSWGVTEVNLASSVPPGGNAVFSFNVTAPSSAGTYLFQWRMMNNGVGFGSSSTAVNVSVTGSAAPLVLTTSSLPFGTRNVPYSAQVNATGGTLPYTWSMTGAPAGLSINASTGLISGTPTATGTFYINVTVRDLAGQSKTKQFKTAFR
jgi:hypothetical protein